VPADRVPHCEWLVVIDPDADVLTEPEITRALGATRLADVVIERRRGTEPGGLEDYSGPLFEQLQLEQLSHGALASVCGELAVQVHLLVDGLMYAVADRYGEEAALAVADFQMTGSGWVVSERLAAWLGCSGGGIDGIASVLQVHPAFQPREYWSVDLSVLDGNRALLRLRDCPARREDMPYGWQALLARGRSGGLEALVRGVDARARLAPVDGDPWAWEIRIDEDATSIEEPLAVQVARGTVLYRTRLVDHVQLLQL
jgi:hypothetical protein